MDLNFHQPRILPGDLHQKSLSRQCLLKRLVRVSKTPATTHPLRPTKQKQKLSNISSALKSDDPQKPKNKRAMIFLILI